MTDFAAVMAHVKLVEGGKVDDPLDMGGRTNTGVTQRTYDRYRLAHALPKRDVYTMEDAERDDIYLHDFWLAGRCDLIAEASDRLALCHFDACIHHGVRAVKKDGRIVGANVMLQEVIGVKRDGWIGPKTLNAILAIIREKGEQFLVTNYLHLRAKRFERIVLANPTQGRFLKGWNRRLATLQASVEGLGVAV